MNICMFNARKVPFQLVCTVLIFQHPVAMFNDLLHRGSLGGATSCRVYRLVVRYVVMYYRCNYYDMFRPCKVIIR
jgi:hypothetical protein